MTTNNLIISEKLHRLTDLIISTLKCTLVYIIKMESNKMQIATFTQLRNNAKYYFDAVENGEIVIIKRHGKTIAEIKPVADDDTNHSWKNPALRLAIKGRALSKTILEERKKSTK